MIRRRRALVFTAVMALVFGWAGGWTPQPDPDRAPDRQLAQPDDPSQPAPLEGTTAIEGSPEAAGRALSPTPKRVEGSWFVELREGLDPQRVSADLARRYGGRAEHVYEHVIHGFNYRGTDADLKRLRDDPMVDGVAPDYEVHAVEEQITNPVKRIRASHPTAMNAFDEGFTGAGVNIGILDTGVDIDHEDLVDNMAPPTRWKNCVGGDVNDSNGHGTRTAGNAAAVANTVGVRGVAPEATIIPIKVLGNGGFGNMTTVACGVDHLTGLALAADPSERFVGNMSLAGGGTASSCGTTGLRQAICDSVAAGVVFTAAAGNAHRDAASFWPASFPEVITVSAMNDGDGEPGGDSIASFSNFGEVVDVIAPGVSVLSTSPNDGYFATSGTSRAAPHAAGVAAIILGIDPGLAPQGVVELMLSTGECPNGMNTGAGPCPSGTWSGDVDGETEPLVHALNAGLGADPSLPRISFNQPSVNDALVGNNVLIEFEVEDLDESAVAETDVASVVLKADATVLESWTPNPSNPSIATPFAHVFDSSDLTDGSHSLSVTVVDNDTKTRTVSMGVEIANATPEFSEDFEPEPAGWTSDGLWHVAPAAPGSTPCGPQPYPSYRRSLYYGQDATCNYDTGKGNRGSAISPLITGVGDDAVLTFASFRSVETTGKKRDIARLYVSYHGGKKWKKVWEQTAKDPADTGWTSNTIDLNPTGAGTVMLRFYFKADRRENLSAGWFVDDILISSTPNDQPVLSFVAPANGAPVSGTSVPIEIGGTDEDAPGTLTGVLLVDDAFQDPLFWDGTDSYDVTWDSTTVPDGFHTLEARMTDSGGAEASVLIDVNVDN